MKKLMAVLLAGAFITVTAVAQSENLPTAKPTVKKETMASTKKVNEKKNSSANHKDAGKEKHQKSKKGEGKQTPPIVNPQTK